MQTARHFWPTPPAWAARATALYQSEYAWLIFMASMDIMFTWIILFFGGREMNWVAERVIDRYDLAGIVLFKFALVVLVLGCCELVGRRQEVTGRRLAQAGVAITCLPVCAAIIQLMIAKPWLPFIAGA